MKLYTEEQVRHLADCIHGASTESILASLTPIELPSDDVEFADWLGKNEYRYSRKHKCYQKTLINETIFFDDIKELFKQFLKTKQNGK
jgi:hypothetical protein